MPEVNEQETSAVDRELSQLLAVEPSAEFAAQVRMRIAAGEARSRRWFWALAPAAIAAGVALILFATRNAAPVQVPVYTRPDIHLAAVKRPVQTPPPSAQRIADLAPRHTSSRRGPSERAMEPEIVIDPSLAAAIRRLTSERPPLPEVPAEPSLDPVVVEPLRVPEISEFAGPGL